LQGRLSEPKPGRTVWTAILKWTMPLAASYLELTNDSAHIAPELIRRYGCAYSPTLPVNQFETLDEREALSLASSALLHVWMIHRRVSGSPSTFREAELWFFGERSKTIGLSFASEAWPSKSAPAGLYDLNYTAEFDDVFPYVVEVFETRQADSFRNRAFKRNIGLYYSPSDVTDYMVREVLALRRTSHRTLSEITCIDPACGSGVFLRALLNAISRYSPIRDGEKLNATTRLYGLDTSMHAIQSCAFTLLLDCIDDVDRIGLVPWHAWQMIRGNLWVGDSTRISGLGATDPSHSARIAKLREEARSNVANGYWNDTQASSRTPITPPIRRAMYLGDIFGEAANGFDIIIGNPPYSGTSARGSQLTFDGNPTGGRETQRGYYLPFVEMMWKFAKGDYSTSSMILPLSIAYHTGSDFFKLRENMQKIPGTWRFEFFDRTPDSLFGDLIKTRNCVVFAEIGSAYSQTRIATTPLIRWNSRNRDELFDHIRSVIVHDHFSIKGCIPKLGSELEIDAYRKLRSSLSSSSVGEMLSGVHAPLHRHTVMSNTLYFYSTAYNWLPIFRHFPSRHISTRSDFRASELLCEDPEEADFLFGVLSSRVSYWLWRVEGDGFHLNKTFILSLPFHRSRFSRARYAEIVELSRDLWKQIQHYPVKKVNAGRPCVNYRPYACKGILDLLDINILESYGVSKEFSTVLTQYVMDIVVAGRDEELKLKSLKQQLAGERN
jgi:hypothetical protein